MRRYEKMRQLNQCDTSVLFHLQDVKYKMVRQTTDFFKNMKKNYEAPIYINEELFVSEERVGGMERVLIVGALTFVGYHLVNKMIAEEVEVYGLDFDEFDSMTKINEEKLLLIGRNALFTYYSIRDEDGWRSVEEETFDTVYFCLYEPNQQSGFRNEKSHITIFKANYKNV